MLLPRMDEGMTENVSVTSQPRTRLRARAVISIAVLLLFLAGFLILTVRLNLRVRSEQQFAYLAKSFLHGELAFEDVPGWGFGDTSPSNGRYYWALGPFSAVVLVPFELAAGAFGVFFYQGYLQPLLVIAVLLLVYRVARVTGYGVEDSMYLAFGFGFATVFLGVALWPWSWYFSQVITSVLLFAAIAEMCTRRRPWLLGILFGLALATRVTAVVGALWCAGAILLAHDPWRKKLLSLIALGLPIVAAVALLMAYNHARFGNAMDPGYAEQLVSMTAPEGQSRALGLFSVHHIPRNLYTLLLEAPSPVRRSDVSLVLNFPYVVDTKVGMAFWVTSPCLLYLLGLRYRDSTSVLLLLTALLTAVPLMMSFAPGGRQFGYRYSLDFLPFLYYLLLRNYRQQRGDLTAGFKAVILGSAAWNLYLFVGAWIGW